MPTTCLICCEDAEYFLLPPCNHKQMCWKCCVTLIQGSTFSCPYCKGTPEGTSCILFVDDTEMRQFTFQDIIQRKSYKSQQKSYQYYSNERVAHFIQESTSLYCRLCTESFSNINQLKKHLNEVHRRQFCDVCLENKKCIISQQSLYTEGELISHLKKGQFSPDGQLMLYHPFCDFCRLRFYDVDAFRAHLRISSHLRCHICEQNFPKLKYVYYKDYPEIEKHFYKSHFVCDSGPCLAKKLENVYVSQETLDEHKFRAHNSGNSKLNKPVVNLILFAGKEEEELEWDRIGKDFSKQFMISEKSYSLKNQQHHDSVIDIRSFYEDEVKNGNRMSLGQIKQKLFELYYRSDFESDAISFTSVPLFTPLEMESLSRMELERFIRQVYQPKYSEPIIQIFFTKKFDFRSTHDYLCEIKRRMWSLSPITYYYVFPQLVRYFKDTNPTKAVMDSFYAESLRGLRIVNNYIFHSRQRYSQILNMLQIQMQDHIYNLMIDQKIDLAVYQKYLRDLNPTVYQQHHEGLFYVQREKIKNMYHMVEKTKTSDLLKLNWLLKLGFSNESYRAIYNKFYYKTEVDCGDAIKSLSLQQLSLLYAYVEICLEVLIDRNYFTTKKNNPPTLFLGTVLSKLKVCISSKDLTVLKNLENKSVEIAAKMNSFNFVKTKKGVVIDEDEHPSLLEMANPSRKVEQSYHTFSSPSMPFSIKENKKPKQAPQATQKNNEIEDDFPILTAANKVKSSKQEEQDFPALSSGAKNSGKIQNKQKRVEQNKSRKTVKKLQDGKLENSKPEKTQMLSARKGKGYFMNEEANNQWPALGEQKAQQAIEDGSNQKHTKKKKKKQCPVLTQTPQPPKIEEVQFKQQFIIKKKTKQQLRAEESTQSKKGKGLKNKKKEQQKHPEPIEQQEPKPRTKLKVRLDLSDSQEQQRKRKQEKKRQKQQKRKQFDEEQKLRQSIRYHEGFDSLLQASQAKNPASKNNSSIINTLIEDSRKANIKQPEIIVKKGKKGKAVVIERVDIFSL